MELSTSQEILTVLRSKPPLTIAEISKQLNLTKADIRYHISRLIKSGQVKITAPGKDRESVSPGRPAKYFTVTDHLYPDNITGLLQIWFLLTGMDTKTLQSAAELMANQIQADKQSKVSFFQNMNHIITALNKRQYAARWEIKPHGPMVYFYNCPYKSLIKSTPQLCTLDQFLLEKITGSTVITSQTLAHEDSQRCSFFLNIHPAKK